MITGWLVALAVLWPLSLATIIVLRRASPAKPWWSWLVALAPVPALVAAAVVPTGVSLELTWLLLGSRWEIDTTRRAFLAAAALVWLLAGWQLRTRLAHDTHRTSLQLGWLLAMSGTVGAMLAQDVAAFYSFFALMSFSAYPLIVHKRTLEAFAAGRVYLSMTVLGELLILTGLVIASRGLVSPQLANLPMAIGASSYASIATLCLWTGFGVKTAVAGLHLWLPGAYTHAPPPVVAVLGGAMINAGVLGLLSTLPLGTTSLTTLGAVIVGVGMVGAFGGALVGVTQRSTTAVLGYSSISQMGLLMIPLGAALHTPAIAPAAIAATTLFAVHHGLAKASLFLAVETSRRSRAVGRVPLLFLFALVGASLAGAPFTSGAAAKITTKYALGDVLSTWPWMTSALSLAAVGTTLLVVRAVWCLAQESSDRRPIPSHRAAIEPDGKTTLVDHEAIAADDAPTVSDREATPWGAVSWLLSVALVLTAVWWLPLPDAALAWPGASVAAALPLLWPIALGLLLSGASAWANARSGVALGQVPVGDLLIPLRALGHRVWSWLARAGGAVNVGMRGSASGTVSGSVSSAVGGSVSKAVGGSVSGNVGGSVSGNVGGSVSGNVGGSVTSNESGSVGNDAARAGGTVAQLLRAIRLRLQVEHPSRADRALRSVAPILFGVLIVATLVLLRRG